MNNLVLDTIKNRRSTRKFTDDQLTEEELQAILEAGIQAPSANNSQTWHFTVIQNREFIKHMNEKSKEAMINSSDKDISLAGKGNVNLFYNAPTLIIVSGKETDKSSIVGCSAAIENMLIAAESIGVGGVWIGMVRFFLSLEDEVKKLNIPEGYQGYYAVALGHKKDANVIYGAANRNMNVINYIR